MLEEVTSPAQFDCTSGKSQKYCATNRRQVLTVDFSRKDQRCHGLIAVSTRFDPVFFITRATMTASIDAFQRLAEVPAESKGD
jgi:hypothetical protein